MTLQEISAEVDTLWGLRVSEIKENNKRLQPYVYAAWKLLVTVYRGKPQVGQQSFSAWLEERGIPRRTGYKLLDRERVARGEFTVPEAQCPADQDEEELDVDESQETAVEPPSSPVIASDIVIEYIDPSESKHATVEQKKPVLVLSPAERTRLKEKLLADLRLYVKDEGKVQAIVDTAIIDALEAKLGRYRKGKSISPSALQKQVDVMEKQAA